MKNIKVSNEQINTLMDLPPISDDKKKVKELKFQLYDDVKNRMGEDWYKFSQTTLKALDFIVFLSSDQGFMYAKPETVAKKNKIGKSTVYNLCKKLIDVGAVVKVNRTSRRQNGLGSAIYIFTQHPYFDTIRQVLNLEWNAKWKPNGKAENGENPCGSKDKGEENDSTYSLPSLSTKHIFKESYITVSKTEEIYGNSEINKVSKGQKWIKYVPKMINKLFANVFSDTLQLLWRKIQLAVKSIKTTEKFDKDHVLTLGVSILRRLVKHENRKQMSVDAMCAYVYKSMVNSLRTVIGYRMKDDMEEKHGKYYYVDKDENLVETNDGKAKANINYSNKKVQQMIAYWKGEKAEEL